MWMTIEMHEKCLEKHRVKIKRMEKELNRLKEECTFRDKQIVEAHWMGLDGFDGEGFLKPIDKNVKENFKE